MIWHFLFLRHTCITQLRFIDDVGCVVTLCREHPRGIFIAEDAGVKVSSKTSSFARIPSMKHSPYKCTLCLICQTIRPSFQIVDIFFFGVLRDFDWIRNWVTNCMQVLDYLMKSSREFLIICLAVNVKSKFRKKRPGWILCNAGFLRMKLNMYSKITITRLYDVRFLLVLIPIKRG